MKAKVHVFLKPGVLDVQGKAVESALHGLGWSDVDRVRVGKVIEFSLGGGRVLGGEVELDGLADADVLDAAPAQAVQRLLDRLALHVEDAGLQDHVDFRLH